MQPLNFQSKQGILISTGSYGEGKDYPGNHSQDDSSIFGKTLFVDLNSLKHFIFSEGHRNVQGLFVHGNKILSTEHGPKGGDELNEILFGKNYGWPISSYGKAYFRKDLKYKRSHSKNGFEEPIFSFVPSIGISELYLVPDDYNEDWKNSILITSLDGRAMIRLKFQSNNYKKILYSEKIYIGQRTRDIKYLSKDKIFLLALETEGQLGILRKKD
jgi:glucose/arabinose dehydrogenase